MNASIEKAANSPWFTLCSRAVMIGATGFMVWYIQDAAADLKTITTGMPVIASKVEAGETQRTLIWANIRALNDIVTTDRVSVAERLAQLTEAVKNLKETYDRDRRIRAD